MKTNFTQIMAQLVEQCGAEEEMVELIAKFRAEGGAHRLRIVADHPDPAVKAAVEKAANRHPALHDKTLDAITTLTRAKAKASRDEVARWALSNPGDAA